VTFLEDIYDQPRILWIVQIGGASLTMKANCLIYIRPHPESNGDAANGRGFEPRAIPLCDVGFAHHCIHETFLILLYAMWA